MHKLVTIFLFVLNYQLSLSAQGINGIEYQKKYQLHMHKTAEPIKFDGELSESIWKQAEVATNFSNWVPQDIGKPKRQTEVRVCYNNQYIYFGVTGFDTTYDIIKTLKRDAEIGSSDGVGITVDAAVANGRDWPPEAVDVFRIVAADETVGMGRIRHSKQSRGIGKAKVEVSSCSA